MSNKTKNSSLKPVKLEAKMEKGIADDDLTSGVPGKRERPKLITNSMIEEVVDNLLTEEEGEDSMFYAAKESAEEGSREKSDKKAKDKKSAKNKSSGTDKKDKKDKKDKSGKKDKKGKKAKKGKKGKKAGKPGKNRKRK